MPTAISVLGLSKRYRIGSRHRATTMLEGLTEAVRRLGMKHEYIWALRDVSFDIQEGAVVGIVGRNGAGKSTLLKILSRITYATQGQVATRGRIAALLEVGTGFHPELTGRDNVYLNGSILGMTRREIRSKLDAIVEFAGVDQFIDTPIKRYSSGMRLRLGFAVAAHLDPDILLVDEILAVGDVEFQRKCLAAIDDLRSGGRTVLFVSHNLAAVENLCERAIWIDGGRVRGDGDTKPVIKAYLSTITESQRGSYDLTLVPSRSGSGDARFTALELEDFDGSPADVVRSGDPLVLRILYEAARGVPNPHFGVKISTDLGTIVAEMSTWLSGVDVPGLAPGPGTVELRIENLDLVPGRYFVSLWVQSVGVPPFDALENCAVLNVETSDFYGSGRSLDSNKGVMLIPCVWRMDGDRSSGWEAEP